MLLRLRGAARGLTMARNQFDYGSARSRSPRAALPLVKEVDSGRGKFSGQADLGRADQDRRAWLVWIGRRPGPCKNPEEQGHVRWSASPDARGAVLRPHLRVSSLAPQIRRRPITPSMSAFPPVACQPPGGGQLPSQDDRPRRCAREGTAAGRRLPPPEVDSGFMDFI